MLGPRQDSPEAWNPEHDDVVERRVEFADAGGGRSDYAGIHAGFHGRQASEFVKLAKSYDAEIRVSLGGDDWENAKTYGNARNGTVDAKSIFGVSRFCGVRPGHPFWIRARGPDAEKAVQALGDALEFRHRF